VTDDGVPGALAPLVEHHVDGLPGEGYELDVTPDGAQLRFADDNGLRYGRAVVEQLRTAHEVAPVLRIVDHPDFPVRAHLLDVSRNRVPTLETLDRLVGVLELARYNQLQLYTEHTFAYRDHEDVWRDASPMTPDDIRWLDARCADAGIELVANQNCLGHMERWLRRPRYARRAARPDGFELVPGVTLPPTTLAPTPDNATFVLDLLRELTPNFTSRRVNIDFDEPFDLDGDAHAYVEQLRRVAQPLVDEGRDVLFWADVVRRHPETFGRIPAGATPIAWWYEAPAASSPLVDLPAPLRELMGRLGIDDDSTRGFDAIVRPLADAGIPFWVAPGTSTWNSLVGRVDNAYANLVDAAVAGRAHGATGFVVTDWGDNGHLQPPSVSFGPLLHGGALAWCTGSNRDADDDVAGVLDAYVFRDGAHELGAALDAIGQVWNCTGKRSFNASPLQAALLPRQPLMAVGDVDVDATRDVLATLDAARDAIARARPASADGDVVVRELVLATNLARLGARRLLGDDVRADLAQLHDEFAACWQLRSRAGGLTDSLAQLGASVTV
jgi:hypothetical protein